MSGYVELKTWYSTLDYFYKKYGYDFKVQLLTDSKKTKWVFYGTDDYLDIIKKYDFVNQRQRMVDELIFDIDIDFGKFITFKNEKSLLAEKIGRIICNRLNKDKINNYYYNSGGDGGHIHAFVDELKEIPNTLYRSEIKKMLISYYSKGFLVKKKDLPYHVCNTGSCSDNALICLENSLSRKGKLKKLIFYNEYEEPSKINKEVYNKFNENIIEKANKPKVLNYLEKQNKTKPPCIIFFEMEDFKAIQDGRKRVAFILISYYKKLGLSDDEIYSKLIDWKHSVLNEYDNIQDFWIKSAISSNKGTVGCRYKKEILTELGISNICKECKVNHFVGV